MNNEGLYIFKEQKISVAYLPMEKYTLCTCDFQSSYNFCEFNKSKNAFYYFS